MKTSCPSLDELTAMAVAALEQRFRQGCVPTKRIEVRSIVVDHDTRDFSTAQAEIVLENGDLYVVQIQKGPEDWLERLENRPPRSVTEIEGVIAGIDEIRDRMKAELEETKRLGLNTKE